MCAISAILLVSSLVFVSSYQHYQWKSIYDRIMEEGDFSGYRTMIKGNQIITLALLYGRVTFFVPQNEAFERYDGFFTVDMLLYHLGDNTYSLKEMRLNNTIESLHGDNPPLWISVVGEDYYINNAKIVKDKSNYVAKSRRDDSKMQVLHVIDQVLDHMLSTPFSNPTAHDFLQNYQHWKLGSRRVSNFFKRIQFHEKESIFRQPGGHTFFIPIDDKRHDHRLRDIDSYIIEAHVVPNIILFTRPAKKDFVYETAANGDYIYIVLTMIRQNGKDYVKSNTVLGNSEHKKGEIFAEIVKGNIPVTNGVVHLVSQPLAVFDRILKPFPYLPVYYKLSADPELNITYHVGQKGRTNSILKREKGMYTFFAPINRAWTNYLGYSSDELSDIISKHIIVSDSSYTMSKLASTTSKTSTTLATLGGSLKLNVVFTNNSFYLIWNQKWIRVIRPDYECSDGVVHLIDDVFATPNPRFPNPNQQKDSFWKMLKNMVT